MADSWFDISRKGNFNPLWGVSEAENNASIRSLAGSGTVQLGDRSLILTAAEDVFGGTIMDLDGDDKHLGGGLVVAGGIQTLSGGNNFSGKTTINAGAALLLTSSGSLVSDVDVAGRFGNDGQVNAATFVKTGGTLTGMGFLKDVTVAGAGIIAPGSALDAGKPVAALQITGSFVQQAGSIYQAGLSSASDLIEVNGKATIESGAAIELVREGDRQIALNTSYTLLTATEGLDGTYDLTGGLVANSPFLDFELSYDPNSVSLEVERSAVRFADVARTFNQLSATQAADSLAASNPLYNRILFLNAGEAAAAFDLLSGEVHASAMSVLLDDSHFVRDAANEHLRAAFSGVGAATPPVMAYGPQGFTAAPATSGGPVFWASGFSSWGQLDGNGNAARVDRSVGGFFIGADTLVANEWRVGAMGGYSSTSFDVDSRLSSGSSDNYHLAAYAGRQWGSLGFRSGIGYSWNRVETDRSVVFPDFADSLSAKYDAGTFQAFGELGYRFDMGVASFEPYANLAYVRGNADAFSERGGAAALYGRDQSLDTAFSTLGLRASTILQLGSMLTTAHGGIGWRHAYGDVTPVSTLAFSGGGLPFSVSGTPIAENAVLVEAGLDMHILDRTTVGIAYQGQFASEAQENGFNARLSVQF